ncbi:MAG: Sec-independent protein translocase protein TatB [Gammaproteobacteria bacterium]|nr:Sec-independent protein translocase protein TatB [Gammaproteobacteria bacterium]
MFDFSFPEFFLAAVVALVILGPSRLPGALRTLGLWIGRLRRNYYNVKTEIEREIGMDEVRRQLHNEQVMADVKRVEREVQAMGEEINRIEEPMAQGPDRPVAQRDENGDADDAKPS